MHKCLCIVLLFIAPSVMAQDDTAMTKLMNSMEAKPETQKASPVFYSQRLINMNTVEVLHKGILEFKVVHNFGDVAGKNGSLKNFFGLDAANDIKIALQLGLTNKLNVVLARARGDYHAQAKLVETGIKYQFVKQTDDNKQPLSITVFANLAISTMAADTFNNIFAVKTKDDRFQNFGDRTNEVIQLMVARRFGNISFQLTPTWVHTGLVVPNDPSSLFAIGAGARVPVTKKFILVADYFHTFRSSASKSTLEQQFATYGNPDESRFYDVLGIGVEILTPGHMFHLNFTNATSILEDRFLRRTYSTWSKGQFHWGFTVARNFSLFRDKKAK